MEEAKEIKRSETWEQIYKIVKQTPRKEVDYDAMDAPSAATELEELFFTLFPKYVFDAYKEGFNSATESLIAANKSIQERKIK